MRRLSSVVVVLGALAVAAPAFAQPTPTPPPSTSVQQTPPPPPRPGQDPGGFTPRAPALANAGFALTGRRLSELPLRL